MKIIAKKIGVVLGLLMLLAFNTPTEAQVVVRQRPARPVHVINKPIQARPGYIWIEGFWNHNGRKYMWVEGNWARARAGQNWVTGRWENCKGGHRWISGYWTPKTRVVTPVRHKRKVVASTKQNRKRGRSNQHR
jgi:hypothetical protein